MDADSKQALATIGCNCLPILGIVLFWGFVAYLILHFVFKYW